ncbi:MAG: SpoIIIAH-like protein [Firmicutes bacterium ADurb.Bin248]|nr:MAG: SpoIIIAH-like protein [Firmicutes bacterium ADurb.Bin248]
MNMRTINWKPIVQGIGAVKKYIYIGVVVLLLAGAVWWSIAGSETKLPPGDVQTQGEGETEGDSQEVSGKAGTDYYEAFRSEREETRKLELAYLDEIIETAGTDSETLDDAQAQKLALVSQMEKEFAIENLIRAKGFSDAAVTFHQGAVSVVVDAKELTSEQAAQILEIVQSETGESAANIKVIPNPK